MEEHTENAKADEEEARISVNIAILNSISLLTRSSDQDCYLCKPHIEPGIMPSAK